MLASTLFSTCVVEEKVRFCMSPLSLHVVFDGCDGPRSLDKLMRCDDGEKLVVLFSRTQTLGSPKFTPYSQQSRFQSVVVGKFTLVEFQAPLFHSRFSHKWP